MTIDRERLIKREDRNYFVFLKRLVVHNLKTLEIVMTQHQVLHKNEAKTMHTELRVALASI